MEYGLKQIAIILLFGFCLLQSVVIYSQTQNSLIRRGNQLYKKGDFDKSLVEYEQAIKLDPQNASASYNFGNALFRKQKWEDAEKNFDNVIAGSKDNSLRQTAFYNKGVSLSKQKKIEESIEAYKNALRLNSNDEDARVNLQKALLERKKNDQSQSNQKQEEKPKQKEKPKPQQSKLNKKEVERLLKALHQKEQEVQQKMQKNRPRGVTPPEKDW